MEANLLAVTPPRLKEKAELVILSSLPETSRIRYLQQYEKFIQWQRSQETTSISENVLLAYFLELSERYVPTTLWSYYSMLHSTFLC